jgi:DNA replicative helicase MCM subunit Mcm2 (Cdc46/Mcm family)
VVRDIRNEESDRRIAEHVVGLHTFGRKEESNSEISLEDLKKYITYTKMNYYPRLTEESGHML